MAKMWESIPVVMMIMAASDDTGETMMISKKIRVITMMVMVSLEN